MVLNCTDKASKKCVEYQLRQFQRWKRTPTETVSAGMNCTRLLGNSNLQGYCTHWTVSLLGCICTPTWDSFCWHDIAHLQMTIGGNPEVLIYYVSTCKISLFDPIVPTLTLSMSDHLQNPRYQHIWISHLDSSWVNILHNLTQTSNLNLIFLTTTGPAPPLASSSLSSLPCGATAKPPCGQQ